MRCRERKEQKANDTEAICADLMSISSCSGNGLKGMPMFQRDRDVVPVYRHSPMVGG